MSDTITVARPYAKALFSHAIATQKLIEWSDILYDLSRVVLNPKAMAFLGNPAANSDQHKQLLLSIFKKSVNKDLGQEIKNLIDLLAQNKRLLLLADIYAQYKRLRAEFEKTLVVRVSSFSKLSSAQQTDLVTSLSKRLQRQVTLEVSIDNTLIGGAIIHAGDLVIDGSVRGKLNKLGTSLAA